MTRLVFMPTPAVRGDLLSLAGCFLLGAALGVFAQAAEEYGRQRREDRAALKAAGAQLERLDADYRDMLELARARGDRVDELERDQEQLRVRNAALEEWAERARRARIAQFAERDADRGASGGQPVAIRRTPERGREIWDGEAWRSAPDEPESIGD